MDVSTRSVVGACLAALVAVAAYFGTPFLVVACLVLVAVTTVGWPVLLDLPGVPGARIVVGVAGAGAVAAVALTPDEPVLRHVPLVLAGAVILAFGSELVRPGRSGLVDSLIGTVCGAVVAVSCAGWIAAGRTDAGAKLVVTCAVALAVATVVSAVRLPMWWSALATVAVAGGAGAALGYLLPSLDVVRGVVCGVVAGLLVAALRALFDQLPELRGVWAAVTAAALPVAVGGTLIVVVGRVIGGA